VRRRLRKVTGALPRVLFGCSPVSGNPGLQTSLSEVSGPENAISAQGSSNPGLQTSLSEVSGPENASRNGPQRISVKASDTQS